MAKYLFICFNLSFVLFLLCSCSPSRSDLYGLYELQVINVDGIDRSHSPEFIEFKQDGSFALSLVKGDYLGFYELTWSKLKLSSESGGRFNANWNLTILPNQILLKGLDDGYRVTEMYFSIIDKVPDFDDFEERVLGTWQIYKTRDNGDVKHAATTFMHIDAKSYRIEVDGQLVENGASVINTRHHKVVFESDDVMWEAWFYGKELRLTNPKNGFQYDLRRVD